MLRSEARKEKRSESIRVSSDISEMNFIEKISLKGMSAYICYNRGQGYKVECTIGARIKVNPPSITVHNHV
jgi:hypothetical protein